MILLFVLLTSITSLQEFNAFVQELDRAEEERIGSPFHQEWNGEGQETPQRINLFKDICWRCAFPIHLFGKQVTPSQYEDVLPYQKKMLCKCDNPLQIGIPFSMWEPMMLIEVTPVPFHFPTLGADFSSKTSFKNRGGLTHVGESGRSSFYNVHIIPFPIFRVAQFLPGFTCLKETKSLPFPWLTELDPTWRYPDLAALFSPDMYASTSFLAQQACMQDCEASNKDQPTNNYPWCAGCLGSLYPYVGYVPHHISGLQASALLVERTLAKRDALRHFFQQQTGFEENNYCGQTQQSMHLNKKFYKVQLLFPFADREEICCHALGAQIKKTHHDASDNKAYVYLIWTKMHCCFDVVGILKKFFAPFAELIILIDQMIELGSDLSDYLNLLEEYGG
jgi:conjugal transfer pilus assembly protein TraU